MSIKTLAAAIAVGAACVALPTAASAGGEIQAYEQTSSYSAAGGGYGAYAPPMPANYARPMGQYYGGGAGCSPCQSMPYGYSYGRPQGAFGSDFLTAGLLGVGLGYLIFH